MDDEAILASPAPTGPGDTAGTAAGAAAGDPTLSPTPVPSVPPRSAHSATPDPQPPTANLYEVAGTRFAHLAEAEFARLLDFYQVEWRYEPDVFPLAWDGERVVLQFRPDFYLPEYDCYIELTVMKQSLVRRKNRKIRLLRERYPGIQIKLLYRRDFQRLLTGFGLGPGDGGLHSADYDLAQAG